MGHVTVSRIGYAVAHIYVVVSSGQKNDVFRKHKGDFMKHVINIGESLAASCTT